MTTPHRTFWRRLAQAATAPKAPASMALLPPHAGLVSALRPLALEQRFMFDGAGAVDAAHAVADGVTTTDAAADTTSALRHALMAEAPAATGQRQEVVFVDGQVANLAELLQGLSANAEVVILDPTKDGLQQMADYLQGRSGLDAIHILSHGDAGKIQLGSSWLDGEKLNVKTDLLATIGKSLSEDGDILLYGCNVGADAVGIDFVNSLAIATGADIAASDDMTGKGGDWNLEVHTGAIETSAIQVDNYQYALDVSNTFVEFQLNGITRSSGTVGSGVELFLDGGLDVNDSSWYVDIDPIASTITMLLRNGIFASDGLTSFNIVFSNGTLNAITSITRDNAATTSAADISATVAGNNKTITFHINTNETGGDGVLVWHFTSTNTGQDTAPTVSGTANNPTFTENGAAVALFSSVAADTHDSGQSFTGAQFIVSNVAGSSEYLTIHGVNVALSNGNSVSLGSGYGTASISVSGGLATITLSGATLSNADMSSLLSGMTYGNSSDNPGSATRTVTLTQLTDSGGSNNTVSTSISSAVTVVPVNDAPTDITLSSTVLAQSQGSNATIATLSTTDVDSTSFTYSLVSGSGSTDNARFTLTGNTLRAVDASAMPAGTYSIRLRTTDDSGAYYEKVVTLTVSDDIAPAPPAAPTLDAASDTGASSTDAITNVTTPTLTGTAEAGSTVTLYDTDGWTTANGSGNWTITSSALSEGSHSLSVIATDTAGNRSTASAKLAITIDTTAPTGLALSTNSVATSMAGAGAPIATLSTSDSGSVTYALAIGNGANNADNSSFTIAGNTLKVNGAALSAGTYHIYLKATDAAGNESYLATTVTVQNSPTVSSIDRAGGASSLVPGSAMHIEYTVTFSEAVTGVDSSDFVLTSTGTASGSIASVSGSGTTYTITVSGITGDGSLRLDLKSSGTGIQGDVGNIAIVGGYTSGQTFTLDHTAPATPAVPTLDAASDTGASSSDRITNDNTPTLTGTAEAGSTVTLYDTDGTTVLGTSTANGSGNWTIISSALAQGAHSLSVTVTDAAGNVSAFSTALQITIDTSAPGVDSVTVPAGGTYQIGETLTFNVNFNEAVLVDTSGGTPRIALTIGSTTRYATYVSGSGTNTLVFSYVVTSGDSDSDGITVGALSTNGGSMRDIAGNNASTTINGMGSTTAVLVDGTTPASVTNISASSANGSYGAGSTITITVDFSSTVNVDTTGGTPSLSLSSGGTASYVGGSGTSTLTFSYTVGAGQNSADLDYSSANALQLNGANITESGGSHRAVAITLAAPGSAGSLGANKDLVIDTVAPTAVNQSVSFSADTGSSGTDLITSTAAQTIVGTLSSTLASDESVWVSLDNGSHWSKATVTGSNWSLSGQTLNAGSNTLQVRVQDAAGNYGPVFAAAYVLDTVAPTVSISSDTSTLKAGETATITFTFSEQVTGFTISDLTAAGGTLSNLTGTADPLVYTVTFTPSTGFSGSGSVTLGNNLYTDLAGNNGSGGSSTPLSIDTNAPGTVSMVLDQTTLNAQQTAVLTVRFSEAVTGLDLADFTVVDGVLSGLSSADGGLTWTATLTPAAGKVHSALQVTLNNAGYTDLAGNAGSNTSSSGTYAINTVLPAQPVLQVQSNAEGSATVHVDALEAGAPWAYSLDGGQSWQVGQGNVVAIASPGLYMLQVRQTNVVGNVSEVATLSVAVAPLVVPPSVEWPVAGIFGSPGIWEVSLVPSGLVPFGSAGGEPVAPSGSSNAFLGDGAIPGLSAVSSFFRGDVVTERGELSLGFLGFGSSSEGGVLGAVTPVSVAAVATAAADGLVLLHPIDAVVTNADRQVDWKVPPTMFGHSDPLASVQLVMAQADGRPLPAWLKFDARTGQVSGVMPAGFQGELTLRLTARDNQGHTVSTIIKLKAADAGPTARAGMAEQLQRHAQLRAGQMAAQRLHL